MTAVDPSGRAPGSGMATDQPPGQGETRSYHGQPIIKAPVWTWEIPCYFFVGGLAGASAGLAVLAGARGEEVLARRAWAASLAGIGVSPAFLISDLGRPERFLNMLRMVKITSPMSIGSWVLSGSGATTALAAAHAWLGIFPRGARVARPAAALLGLPLATYTAALVADTAVPVWHEARRELPLVFASGAALSAGAAAMVLTPVAHAAPARRLALLGTALELVSKRTMEKRLGEQGEPYEQGAPQRFTRITYACAALGSGLLAWRGARSRPVAGAAGALLMGGALSARWSVYKAGFASAADPKYVVMSQRRRIAEAGGSKASRTTVRPSG
jgi:hypothetical protein